MSDEKERERERVALQSTKWQRRAVSVSIGSKENAPIKGRPSETHQSAMGETVRSRFRRLKSKKKPKKKKQESTETPPSNQPNVLFFCFSKRKNWRKSKEVRRKDRNFDLEKKNWKRNRTKPNTKKKELELARCVFRSSKGRSSGNQFNNHT